MTTLSKRKPRVIEYPTSDGKPMAETDWHRNLMFDLINRLDHRYADDPDVYVSGNLLLFYERGNKRKHVSPDTFVVFGVVKKQRPNYLLWREKKSPSFIMEMTSSSTKKEDITTKFVLYRDVLKAKEYFQFDPFGDYLNPQLQGYRLQRGEYVPIAPVAGRLPCETLGLHLEASGERLLLWDPVTKQYVPTAEERVEQEKQRAAGARQDADEARQRADDERKLSDEMRQRLAEERQRAADERQRAEEARQRAAAERLRREQAERENVALLKEIERLRERLDSKKNGH